MLTIILAISRHHRGMSLFRALRTSRRDVRRASKIADLHAIRWMAIGDPEIADMFLGDIIRWKL